MEILITGNINYIAEEFYANFTSFAKIVLCNAELPKIDLKNAEVYRYDIENEEFSRLFRTYNFDVVLYFSYVTEKNPTVEIANLDQLTKLCRLNDKIQFIYIKPNDTVLAMHEVIHHVSAKAGVELYTSYAKDGYSFCVLRTPFLVSKKKIMGWVLEFIQNVVQKKEITSPFLESQKIDFLFLEDLAGLLVAIIDEEEKGFVQYEPYGGNEKTIEELLYDMGAQYDRKNITYGMKTIAARPEAIALRHRFGWFPQIKIEDYVFTWMKTGIGIHQAPGYWKALLERRARLMSWGMGRTIHRMVEFTFLFGFSEYLTWITRNSTVVNFADFRLFFIMICGMAYGLNYGLAAAVASSVAYILTSSAAANWQIQLYNIINWLPFATYFLLGAMLGYTKERYEDSVQSATQSQEIMEKKYVYLNELYVKVLENKESYSSQIVNYENSFGRIYAATQKLNAVNASELFYQALIVLEDMLGTKGVAIYSIDGENFARLNACSKELNTELTRSIRLSDLENCIEKLQHGETWINKERRENYPDYAYGISREGEMYGMITIWHAEYKQMGIDYLNRFNILSGLISDSLIRAAQYQELSEAEAMIKDTKIMKYEFFIKEIESQKKLKQGQLAGYALLYVHANFHNYVEASEALSRVIRKNDILGVDKEGSIYILLTQAKEEDREIITNRMHTKGFTVEWMPSEFMI